MIYTLSTSLLLALCLLIPLMVKWELDRTRSIPVIIMIGIGSGLVAVPVFNIGHPSLWVIGLLEGALIVTMAAALLLWRFFRDPERACPPVEDAVLSAADGTIVYVKRFTAGQIPVSQKKQNSFALEEFARTPILPASGYLIGTAMSYLDVHINRAPIGGKVRLLRRISGRFESLKHLESVFQNERVSTVIEHPDLTVGMVQIASRLVRNIVPFVKEQSLVQQGQRIGKIRFGSQVDLILPDLPRLHILVAPGDKVKAGLSVIARYEHHREVPST